MIRLTRIRRARWAVAGTIAMAGIGLLGLGMRSASNGPPKEEGIMKLSEAREGVHEAILAGGCFWCIEAAFQNMPGVIDAISGYTGGDVEDPTYEQVSSGSTGHVEAVLVRYDPSRVSYPQLLDQFWRSINPTDPGGQFYDRGSQYGTAIFYMTEEQRVQAEASKEALEASGLFEDPIVTPILPAKPFYVAEPYHQDYFERYTAQYKAYSVGSGRVGFLEDTWNSGDGTDASETPWENFIMPPDAELRERLTRLQYSVTQEDDTEMAFANEYWDHHEEGIYVDIVSGEPLFSSTHKFDSGSGWPSFTQPIAPDAVTIQEDDSWVFVRTEVRSRIADSHLGHLFDDGPPPTGMRYCVNSAALRFVPREDMQEEGYAAYLGLFETEE